MTSNRLPARPDCLVLIMDVSRKINSSLSLLSLGCFYNSWQPINRQLFPAARTVPCVCLLTHFLFLQDRKWNQRQSSGHNIKNKSKFIGNKNTFSPVSFSRWAIPVQVRTVVEEGAWESKSVFDLQYVNTRRWTRRGWSIGSGMLYCSASLATSLAQQRTWTR